MNPRLSAVFEHMRDLGLGALAHANGHANYTSFDNDKWPELSVLQAAHAAEILIKARIAQEHPLLIFEQLPRSTQINGDMLEIRHLVEKAKTIQYVELPDHLWAVTGIYLDNVEKYQAFGRLRNAIQHFVPPPNIDYSLKTIEFIFGVIDPFINKCWGLYAIDYNEDTEPYEYIIENLIQSNITFLVSPDLVDYHNFDDFNWPEKPPKYRLEMEKRFEIAKLQKNNS